MILCDYTYLYGFTAEKMKHSPNPLSNHNVFPNEKRALQKDSCCTPSEIQVELGGTTLSLLSALVSSYPPCRRRADCQWINLYSRQHFIVTCSENLPSTVCWSQSVKTLEHSIVSIPYFQTKWLFWRWVTDPGNRMCYVRLLLLLCHTTVRNI